MKVLQEHEIHLVMTDQRMPRVTGVEFLSQIKTKHPTAMRLIFTGYADVQAVIDAINQGNVFRYVAKPWDPEELLLALRQAGERYDRLAERNQLLDELRTYESQCIVFSDDLLSGKNGHIAPSAVGLATELVARGRQLILRLDETLEAVINEPAH